MRNIEGRGWIQTALALRYAPTYRRARGGYILHVRPTNLTGATAAFFESTDCSGQGYMLASELEQLSSRSMAGTVAIIASMDPVKDPKNETLWEADASTPSLRNLFSVWDTQAQDDPADSHRTISPPISIPLRRKPASAPKLLVCSWHSCTCKAFHRLPPV
jgi:hypothetical protein